MLASRKSRKWQRGAAALEFALVAPILIMLVFGIVDFGLMLNSQSVFANATRDAARAGSFFASKSEIQAVITSGTSYLPNTTDIQTAVSCRRVDNSVCSSNYDAQREAGGVVIVEVTYDHHWMTPGLLGLPEVTKITKRSEMRIE